MSKRQRSSSSAALTGGTGDVNPQLFKFPNLEGTAAAVESVTVSTPLPAFNIGNQNRAIVMEVLKAYFSANTNYNTSGSPSKANKYLMVLPGTAGPSGDAVRQGWANKSCLAFHGAVESIAQTSQADSTPGITSGTAFEVDLTDGAGHGTLLATNTVTFAQDIEMTGNATISFNRMSCALLYRFKEVDLSEYMGIIQSQTRAI